MSVFLSQMLPDSALDKCALSAAIASYAAGFARGRSRPEFAGPDVAVTFLLPGAKEKPTFTGMRLVRVVPREPSFEIQVAVPERILQMSDPQPYVGAVLRDAIDGVQAFIDEERFPCAVDQYHRAVGWVESGDIQTQPSGRLGGVERHPE